MHPRSILAVGIVALGLCGCVGDVAVAVPADHPASARAPSGLIEVPTALSGYKRADDFETPAPAAPGMRGMDHGGAPGGASHP